jgi:hypothetical protein
MALPSSGSLGRFTVAAIVLTFSADGIEAQLLRINIDSIKSTLGRLDINFTNMINKYTLI